MASDAASGEPRGTRDIGETDGTRDAGPTDGTEAFGNAADRARGRVGLALGPLAFLALLLVPAPAGLSPEAWRTAALAALMAVWWLTEAIPLPATALLPLILLPLLGVGGATEAAAPYANPIIFLFLGGFLIALGMQRWGLHRRIALTILRRAGTRPASLVAGFMAATAFLSMWVSNTATAMMMLPIGVSVLGMVAGDKGSGTAIRARRHLETALLLGIAYAASIGGLGTLIGTPPNAFLAAFMLEAYEVEVGFARWLLFGLPVVVVVLPLTFWLLTRVAFPLGREAIPGGRGAIERELARLGPLRGPERAVAVVFAAVAVLWVVRPLLERWVPGLTDPGIAMAGGLALFLIPRDLRAGEFVMSWAWAERLPWGILLLFGGGLSLAAAIDRTGLNLWIGEAASGLAEWPLPLFLALVAAFIIFLTELTSNTATAAAFLPILGAVAVRAGWDPLVLAAPAALAASCAFMLPVATPPNAIVYGSGRLEMADMARAGLWLNLLMIVVVTLAGALLLPLVFGG